MNRPTLFRRAGVVACAAACALLAACPFDKPEDHLARGKEQAAKQDHNAAAIEFKNYLQSNPRSAEARFLLGRELLAQGQVRAAEIELQKAYDARYDRDAVVPLLVQSQILQGQPEKISPQIAATMLKSPLANARLQWLIGLAALAQGRVDDALKSFRTSQLSDPDLAGPRLGEARVDAIRGKLDDAAKLVTDVLDKEPNNVDGNLLKGDIARARNEVPAAISAYQVAIKQAPRQIEARLNLAGVYIATNDMPAAQAQVEELKKIAPRHPGVNYLDALFSFTKKDYLHANDAIALSLNENPGNGAAQILSGAVAYAMNQPAQAEVHLLEGIRLTPNSLYARRLLTTLYLRQKQPQKANDILQPALANLPDNGVLLGLGGDVATQLGDYTNAARLYDRASKADPGNADLRVSVGGAELARGDEAAGFAALEAATKTSGDNPRPDFALVVARLNHRQFDEALAAWRNLEKLQPDNPVTYNLRAAIDLGRKDPASARKALERAIQLQPTYFPAVANLAGLDETEGHPDAAKQRYRALLEKDKTATPAFIALAVLEAKYGAKPEVVLPLLQEARRTSPNAEQPVIALVDYHVSRNNLAQALSVAQDASTRAPNNPTFLDLVGQMQLRLGAADQALAAYRSLTSAKPEVLDYQVRLGQAMLLANQFDAANALFQTLLKKSPDAYGAQVVMVSALLQARRTDDAARLVADLRKAGSKSPMLGELDGDVKNAAKQYGEAAAAYQKALAQTPSPTLVIKQSFATQLAGRGADANAVLANWLKAHPTDVVVRKFDADLALQAKDFPRAEAGYRKVLETTPDDALVINNLAWALWQQKNPQAMQYAQRAHDLAPASPFVNDTLGWLLVESGDTRKGLDLLQQAYATQPSVQSIALHVAKAQIKDGQKDAARRTLQALQKVSPDSAEAKESKGLLAAL